MDIDRLKKIKVALEALMLQKQHSPDDVRKAMLKSRTDSPADMYAASALVITLMKVFAGAQDVDFANALKQHSSFVEDTKGKDNGFKGLDVDAILLLTEFLAVHGTFLRDTLNRLEASMEKFSATMATDPTMQEIKDIMSEATADEDGDGGGNLREYY